MTLRRLALAIPLALVLAVVGAAYLYAPPVQAYAQPADSRFVETALARFHYLRKGNGPPLVLLSPGSSWAYAWRPQLDALSRDHTVYVLDLPGQGFTELRDKAFRYDLDGTTTAIGAFLDAVGVPAAALAGNSWSGGWALAYAQAHPDRVTELLLLAPSGLDERDPLVWELLKVPVLGELLTSVGYASRDSVAGSVRDLFVHQERVTDEVIDAMWKPNTFPENLRSVYLLERGLDWSRTEAALPRVTQPVLLLWGNQDSVLPVRQADRFKRLLPDAEVHRLDACGHALTLDCSERVTALMEDFLGAR